MQIGPYSVVRQIGRGGMGTVYEVRHPEIPRSLALKVVRSDILDEVAKQRFQREGEALAAITHPNVVSVHQLETIEQHLVLVTEFVEGTSLHDLLRSEGSLEGRRAQELLSGVASAISQLHQRGLIHRDLKPDNVLVRPEGTPVVIDFGLARHAQEGSSLTQTGEILGTPSFMAPEQARDASRADARSDVFALGALLFTCLAGHPPFQGATTLDTLDRVLHSPPEWPEGAEGWPRHLRRLCEAALAKDPAVRPADAEAFLAALHDESSGPGVRRLVWAGGGLLLGAVALVVGLRLSPARTGASAGDPVAEAIRRGEAPLPSAFAEAEVPLELQRWRGVHALLSGQVGPEVKSLATGSTPGATALGAVLAALAGDRVEVERLLQQHGQPRRQELRLLPALASAHAGGLSGSDARLVSRLLKSDPALLRFEELRGLQALAGVAGSPSNRESLDDERLPVWARERLLLGSLPDPLDESSLTRISAAASWVSGEVKAELTKRVGDLLRRCAPHEDQEDFGPEQVRLVTHALQAYRSLEPAPAPVPRAEDLIKFMLSSGVDVIAGKSAQRTSTDFDFAITLADAFPNEALVQSAAGQSVWSARLASPERWRRLLVIAWRELELLDREAARVSLGQQRLQYRVQVRSRIRRLLTGLQEALPPAERDPKALQTARELAAILRKSDRNYTDRSFQIDNLYIRFLEGKLSAEEVEEVPADWRTVRLDLIRFAFKPSAERYQLAPKLFETLGHAKREVSPGILIHRAALDYLWPPEGPGAATLELLTCVEWAAKALQGRNPRLSFFWWVQAARLASAESPDRGRRRCTTISIYARRAGWHEFADKLLEASKELRDEALVVLAEEALRLPQDAPWSSEERR